MAVKRVKLKEFFVEPFTYNILKNKYIWFGFLIGMLFPAMCFAPHFNMCISNPLHWFYFAIPFIFAFIFGCVGTFKVMKEAEADSYRMLYKIKTKESKNHKGF